jgi:hypothetical protein
MKTCMNVFSYEFIFNLFLCLPLQLLSLQAHA